MSHPPIEESLRVLIEPLLARELVQANERIAKLEGELANARALLSKLSDAQLEALIDDPYTIVTNGVPVAIF